MHKKKIRKKRDREKVRKRSENCMYIVWRHQRIDRVLARLLSRFYAQRKGEFNCGMLPRINDNVEGYILRDPDLVPIARSL